MGVRVFASQAASGFGMKCEFRKHKTRALISGVTGDDGSYLAELLLVKGYEVDGSKQGVEPVPYDSSGSPSDGRTRQDDAVSSPDWRSFGPDEFEWSRLEALRPSKQLSLVASWRTL